MESMKEKVRDPSCIKSADMVMDDLANSLSGQGEYPRDGLVLDQTNPETSTWCAREA
jgi:hypothetical protein